MADNLRDRVTNTIQKRANPLMRRLRSRLCSRRRAASPVSRAALRWAGAGWATSSGSCRSSASSRNTCKNIKADPAVRVRLRGRWHNGTAHLMPEDDPHARLRSLPQFNSFGVRTFGTNLLTIRVDLTAEALTLAPHKSNVSFTFLPTTS